MKLYKEYATLRDQINILTDKKKDMEGKILQEIKDLPSPQKSEFGTFSKVENKTWKFPNEVVSFIADQKILVDDMKEKSIMEGRAEVTIKFGLRFSAIKKENK